ncbi:hypothetical protein F2Q69_00041686 [Brassica cretica]|uniref:Uncharacterized protein n=1 Tax=Brassica cretica TaxID=69181 RepID=A0A8S9NK48_BRACR|nr:hypothetical protein F2Q69_00041686 [Brassica cretica]
MKVGVAPCVAEVGSAELASPISTSELFFSLREEDILDRKIGRERTSESRTKVIAGELNRHAGQLAGELNHHASQLAGELNRRVVALAQRSQPSRRSARRRAEPSRGCVRRRVRPSRESARPASST